LELYKIDRGDLKDPPFVPRVPPALRKNSNIFYAIQQGDILLHHPFDSFTPVGDFIRAAAADEDVLAIKQTLYRVGSHSPIVGALLEAAEAGKQVAVLVELKARFDEENNIEWARALEQAGVHVTYGLIGLKTHCKVALVVRKEGDGIRRYVHLGTGNYNPATARGYTDMGLLTCHPDFGADVSDLFNYLTGYSKQTRYRKLLVAPIAMRAGLLALIEREIKHQAEHGNGRLIFKMNALVDPAIIEALYRASQSGVKVDLLVRGICCLRPGVPKISDNIRVVSIVGRFLEHHRIFYFRNGGKEEIFMGSADLMPRNLDNRVEVLFPIEDESIRAYVLSDVLEAYLRDNYKARVLQSDGSYARVMPPKDGPVLDAQAALLSQAGGDSSEMTVAISALPNKYRKYLTSYGRVDPHE
jgi:polyphosphate kinase